MMCKFEHDGDCCNCGSPQYMCKCKPKLCGSLVPMTNGDRIRAMSDEELAKFISSPCQYQVGECDGYRNCGDDECLKHILDCLQLPAMEDT